MRILFTLLLALASLSAFTQTENKVPARQLTDLGVGANGKPNLFVGQSGTFNGILELHGGNIDLIAGTFSGQSLQAALDNINAAAGSVQSLTTDATNLTISGSNSIAKTDVAPIQTINYNGSNLTPASGVVTFTEVDGSTTNEIQNLVLTGDVLSIQNGAGTVDLSTYVGTDDQNLVVTGDVLSIQGGTGTVDLSTYVDDADADPANELQTLSKVGSTVSLSNGGLSFTDEVNDADADATNEINVATQTGNEVVFSNGGGTVSTRPVSAEFVFPITASDVSVFTLPANFDASTVYYFTRNGVMQEVGNELTVSGNQGTWAYAAINSSYDTRVVIKWYPQTN